MLNIIPSTYTPIIGIILLLNLFVFFLYGIDKYKAIHHKWRIPEATLITSSLFGVIGAILGMSIWHHKTKKAKFYITIPLILILELVAVIYVFFFN